MTYIVLARQYRPKDFSTLLGQEHVVLALSNALKQQRLHHAYLFTGTRGVGKTTISRILAKSLNCLGADGNGGITDQPCGVCTHCVAIDQGRFTDYIELDAASNRGVDEIQQLLEQAVYKPVQGRFKVFMIDEVHMMTNHAFNAMLKTLEEPPEYLKFVLATTDPQKVPVTVLSRCLQFNLRPIPPDTIVDCLSSVLEKEQISAEAAALQILARAAKGSMRDALSLTDQAIAFGQGNVQAEQVRQMLGAVDDRYIQQIIQALAQADGRTIVEIVNGLRRQGLSAHTALEEIIGITQQMAVEQLAATPAGHADAAQQQIIALAQQLPPDETQLLYSLCLHGLTELGLAPDQYAALTMVLLRLLAFKKKPNAQPTAIEPVVVEPVVVEPVVVEPVVVEPVVVEPVVVEPVAVEPVAVEPVAVEPVAVEPVAVEPVAVEPVAVEPVADVAPAAQYVLPKESDNLAQYWIELMIALAKHPQMQAMVQQLALNSELVAKQDQSWQLLTKQIFSQNLAIATQLEQILAAAGLMVRLELLVADKERQLDSWLLRQTRQKQLESQQAEQLLLQDEYVNNLMQTYAGRFIPESLGLVKAEPKQ